MMSDWVRCRRCGYVHEFQHITLEESKAHKRALSCTYHWSLTCASDSVVFLRHCALYKFIYLLTYFIAYLLMLCIVRPLAMLLQNDVNSTRKKVS